MNFVDVLTGLPVKWLKSIDGAASVTTSPPRYSVSPTVNGIITPEVTLSAAANNAVLSARAAFNATDIVSAGLNIKNRYPDVKAIENSDSIIVESESAITKIYCVGLSTAANTGGNVIAIGETDEAVIRAELVLFEFDIVDDVRTVEISIGSLYTSGTVVEPAQFATLRVEGFSHA